MRRRLPFASYFTGSAFFAASLVTACQNSDPAPLSQTASPVEEEGPPDYIDFSSTSWREIGAPYPMLEHKAAPLENGRILVTGGVVQTPSQETTAAAYVFTPGSDTWDAVGPMVTSRASHSATTLEDGRVLVFGGTLQGEDLYQFHASSEVFDPITATWTDLPTGFSFGWAGHTAVRLDDGSVLAFGGFYDDGVTRAAGLFTLYDGPPGYWYSTLWLPQPRYGHAATVAPTGSVFLTGGFNSQYAPSDVVYRLAPHEYGDWEEYGYLAEARVFHTATALKDGRILVAGGQDASGLPLKSTQFVEEAPPIYSSSITPLAAQPPAPLLIERVSHTAGLLPDGRVIVVGGRGLNGPLASTEIFDPATLTWSLGPELQVPRSHHEMVIHAGRIFVVGGMDDDWQALASVEVLEFGKSNGETCSDDAACLSGHCVDGVCCESACEGACVACAAALKGSGVDGVCEPVADGTNPREACPGTSVCQAAECLLPTTDLGATWRSVNGPITSYYVTAASADDEHVLAISGVESEAEAYLFAPGSDTWTPLPPPSLEHFCFTATKLLDDRVLVAGGFTAASELFDSASSSWIPIGNDTIRTPACHTDVLAPDGRVLLIGGFLDSYSNDVDIYDPDAGPVGTWSPGPDLPYSREGHTATALPNGAILITGGSRFLVGPVADTFVLDPPYDGTWAETASLSRARSGHTATRLLDGRVLIVGGYDDNSDLLANVEIVTLSSTSPTQVDIEEVAPMFVARSMHTAGLLPDGRVIVVGGDTPEGPTAATEIYDPVTNEWSFGPSLNIPRVGHEMVVLPKHIVVIGGNESGDAVEVLSFTKKDLGESCASDGECSSGHCVDGVCCDTACEGACVACTAALKGSGADGVCGGVVDGTNPRSACEGGEVCQAGVCVAPSACAGQPDGTECGAGKVCENGACVDAPTECEGQANGTICSIGDGCTMGICQQGSCVETHKLDGTRCEGGICVAGECKADPHVAPTTGAGGSGGSATGSGSDDGTGPGNGSGSASDDGGGCRIARGSESSSPVALSAALLTGLALLRRRSASRARA